MPLDQTEAINQLNAELGKVAYTATTAPIMGRLMTAMGASSAVNGTEVANSGGSTYAAQNIGGSLPNATANGTAGAVSSNTAAITWSNLPTCTVVGTELWDSAGTPKRKRYGTLTASKSVALGDSLTMAAAALVATQA